RSSGWPRSCTGTREASVASPEAIVLAFLLNALWQLPVSLAAASAGAARRRGAPPAQPDAPSVAGRPAPPAWRRPRRPAGGPRRPAAWSGERLLARRGSGAEARENQPLRALALGKSADAQAGLASRSWMRAAAGAYLLLVAGLSLRLLRALHRTRRVVR